MMPSRGGIQQKGIDSCVLFSHEFRFFFFTGRMRKERRREIINVVLAEKV